MSERKTKQKIIVWKKIKIKSGKEKYERERKRWDEREKSNSISLL